LDILSNRLTHVRGFDRAFRRGRPSNYNSEVAWAICDRLVGGESLRRICSDAGTPGKATVFRWIARHKEFRDRYIGARDSQAEGLGEEMFEIVRDTSGDNLARAGPWSGRPPGWRREKNGNRR
jgi:hypothetical protein